jgi:hypothetical protein
MKKLLLVLLITLLPSIAWSKCVEAPDMGVNFHRCENDEAVCYGLTAHGLTASISCFKK